MLAVYGSKMPLRLLEEIAIWKMREMQHTEAIREILPELESPYRNLMLDWHHVFAKTREQAQAAIRAGLAGQGEALPPEWQLYLPVLLEQSVVQSREFVRQLLALQERSAACRRSPVAAAVLAPIRRQSEYFLGAMEELTRTGQSPWLTEGVTVSSLEETGSDSPESYGGPEPADVPLRPEGTWSDPLAGMEGGESRQSVPIGGHKLPPLPYRYNALEPCIDEKTMRLHHDKHHQSYVDGLNNAEKKLEEARRTGHFDLVRHWERELAFNGAGHYLHTIFWDAMSPRGGGKPSGALAGEIDRSFGGFDAFKKHFTEAATKVEGNGWAILVWSPRSHRLEILTAERHQNLSQWDVVPLLPLDVWEHAYYLKHQNDRASYVKDWWNVVNWPYVADRYTKARTLQWPPY
ncbi:superoxide dismutase [Cohnella pontilimi]|uniref:superoxide dismutase n=1 Tax=Cohnella pontilimi TaxID=2564100 RepID=A0A4U0FC26_9BACL|nr:Fe-Mn family superoxide dismutase [Cohnella pontilimi]TJY42406.1 superoxide dismutase [Cohnella pontilimi]